MLMLGRTLNQDVVITTPPSDSEQTILVRIITVRGNTVKLGFEAKPNIVIHRREIQDQIQEERNADQR